MSEDIRIGVSPLSTEHISQAVQDEMLIHPVTGSVYYKRLSDGIVVGGGYTPYTTRELAQAITSALQKSSFSMPSSDHIFIYETLPITGQNNMMNTDTHTLTSPEYTTSGLERGIFMRVYGEHKTNAWIKYLEMLDATNAPSVKVTLSVIENVGGSDVATSTIVAEMPYNELTFVPLTENENATLRYTIDSIEFPKFLDIYRTFASGDASDFVSIGYNGGVLEAFGIDLVNYVTRVPSVSTIVGNNRDLHYVGTKEESMGGGGTSIIVSKEQPQYECIWAEVLD